MTWGEFLLPRAWQLGVVAVLLTFSAFFSASETALFSLSPGQLHRLRRSRRGQLAASLMLRPQQVLHCLLLGNLLVNVAYSAISAVAVLDLQQQVRPPGWAIAIASFLPLLLLILVGEVMPKALALVTAERWATAAAVPLSILRKVLAPIILALHKAIVGPLTRVLAPRRAGRPEVSTEELAALLDLTARRGILDRRTSSLLQEIMELSDLRVGDIMVPRVDIVCYDVDAPSAGLMQVFRRTRLRRIPVYQRDVDHILGVVHSKRVLLSPDAPLRDLLVKVPFVPEAANLERTLLQLRVKRSQVAIVVDEYGGTAGLVTLEDILEEVVGDLPDPHEAQRGPPVVKVAPRRYVLDGDLPIHEWTDLFEMGLAGQRISTIGGYVTSLLGHIPAGGEAADYRNLRFTVLSIRRRRIDKLQLDLLEDGP